MNRAETKERHHMTNDYYIANGICRQIVYNLDDTAKADGFIQELLSLYRTAKAPEEVKIAAVRGGCGHLLRGR
jgi:hypothetical protein